MVLYKSLYLEGFFFFYQHSVSVRPDATLICMHAQGKFGESARLGLSLFLHAILSRLSVECLSQSPARRASHKHRSSRTRTGIRIAIQLHHVQLHHAMPRHKSIACKFGTYECDRRFEHVFDCLFPATSHPTQRSHCAPRSRRGSVPYCTPKTPCQ